MISSFLTGWTKVILLACREIPPSGLDRGAPYLRSPLIGQPDGAADACKLASDLMVPPCQELYFYEKVAVGPPCDPVSESGELCVSPALSGFADVGFVLLFHPVYHVFEFSFGGNRLPADEGPVEFMDFAVTEHGIQPFKGLGGLGEHGDPAYGTVYSVRNAQEDFARLGIPLGYECFQGVSQRLVSRLVSLCDLSRFLVYDNDMIVFIEDA